MRKKSTRIVSAVLAASMTLSIAPVPAFAAGNNTAGIPYNVLSSRMLEQENSESSLEEITIKMNNGVPEGIGDSVHWEYNPSAEILYLYTGIFTLEGTVKCRVNISERENGKDAVLKSATIEAPLYIYKNAVVEDGVTVTGSNLVANFGTINGGNFGLADKRLYCASNYGTINNGTFYTMVTNESGAIINGGTFNEDKVTNRGTINNGTFNYASQTTSDGTLNGGIFMDLLIDGIANGYIARRAAGNTASSSAYIQLDQSNYYAVNGINELAAWGFFDVQATDDHPQIVTIKPANGDKVSSWTLTVGSKSKTIEPNTSSDLASQYSPLVGTGLKSGAVDNDGTLTLKITNSSLLKKLTLTADTKPAVEPGIYTDETKPEGFDENNAVSIRMGSGSYKVEAGDVSLTDPDKFYAVFDGTTEQTLTVTDTSGKQPTAWHAQFVMKDGTAVDGGYFSVGHKLEGDDLADNLRNMGVTSIESTGNQLIIKAKNVEGITSATLNADYRTDLYAAEVKAGGTVLSYGDTTLDYSAEPVTITVNGTEISDTDLEDNVFYTEPGGTSSSSCSLSDIGKPGKYELTIFAPDDSTTYIPNRSVTFNFTIEKGKISAEDAKQYYSIALPENADENGSIPYTGKAPEFTASKKEGAPEKMGEPEIIGYRPVIDGVEGSLTTEAPTAPGDYVVVARAAANDYYEQCEITAPFTIRKAELPEGTLTYDPETGLASTDPDVDANDFHIKQTIYTNTATGDTYDESTIKNAPTGLYDVSVTVESNNYETVTVNSDSQYEVFKHILSDDSLKFDCADSVEYDGKPHGVSVSINEENPPLFDVKDEDIKVIYYDEAGNELDGAPTDAGEYDYSVVISNENYAEHHHDGSFTITKCETPVDADAITFNKDELVDLKARISAEDVKTKLLDALCPDALIAGNDITITLYDEDGNVVDADTIIRQKGTYTFSVLVNGSANHVGSDGKELTDENWTFDVVEDPHTISFKYPASSSTIPSDIAKYFTWTAEDESGELSKDDSDLSTAIVGTSVTLRWEELNKNYSITSLKASYTEDGMEQTLTGKKSGSSFSFEMPDAPVTISVSVNASTPDPDPTPDPVPDTPSDTGDGFGTAVAVVAGGAAVGGAAYLIGTQVYLESVLPQGAAIPTNRQQLADLLWTTAGRPEPQSSVLFTDISAEAVESQKAARWCVEQGLLKDNGECFRPSDYTFRVQVIRAWNDLQAKLNPAE